MSSASSLTGMMSPASVELPQGLESLIAASVNLQGEEAKRTATLKWGQLPAQSAVETRDRITLQHTEIASEGFLEEILDLLWRALGKSPTGAALALPAMPTADIRPNIRFITHRVVHGAELPHPYVINNGDEGDQDRLHMLERLESLAPLHNIVSTHVIKLCLKIMPNAKNLCLWDTAFHASIPEEIRTYPVCQPDTGDLRGGLELRKYGFHGLSYASVLRQVSAFLERPVSSLNLIVAHLGSGASICAVRAGKSLDTSMGLTPLEGLPGSTRSGSVDPALSHHLKPDPNRQSNDAKTDLSELGRVTIPGGEGIQLDWAEWELNSKSGWLAIAGTRDFAEVVARKDGRVEGGSDEDRRRAKLAFDLFVDRIISFVGSFTFKILAAGATQIDALVFSGGIGEHSTELRMALAAKLEHTPLALRSADGGYYGSDKVGGVRRILGPGKEEARSWWGVDEYGIGKAAPAPPGSPLGPTSSGSPGSPRASHLNHRWGVPWLVCETDEELECVRIAMPTLRDLFKTPS